jgi:hypothetical protein
VSRCDRVKTMKRISIHVLVMLLTLAMGIAITPTKTVDKRLLIQERTVDKRLLVQERQFEEYAVYSALLRRYADGPPILIKGQTISTMRDGVNPHDTEFVRLHIPDGTGIETLEDYAIVDSQPLSMVFGFKVSHPYALIDVDDYESYFGSEEGFARFRKAFPSTKTVTLLSRVGFNRTMDEALVYSWSYCGGDCGGGGYYLLKKTDGVWTISGHKHWIS